MSDLVYPAESYGIIGACFEVYNEKGSGLLEPVYHDCLELEFGLKRIPFLHEPSLQLSYKGQPIAHSYSPDFTCWEKVVVELKAVEKLTDEHVSPSAQLSECHGLSTGAAGQFRTSREP